MTGATEMGKIKQERLKSVFLNDILCLINPTLNINWDKYISKNHVSVKIIHNMNPPMHMVAIFSEQGNVFFLAWVHRNR